MLAQSEIGKDGHDALLFIDRCAVEFFFTEIFFDGAVMFHFTGAQQAYDPEMDRSEQIVLPGFTVKLLGQFCERTESLSFFSEDAFVIEQDLVIIQQVGKVEIAHRTDDLPVIIFAKGLVYLPEMLGVVESVLFPVEQEIENSGISGSQSRIQQCIFRFFEPRRKKRV